MSVVDKFELEAPKTKAFNEIIANLEAPKKTLFVVSEGEDFEMHSLRHEKHPNNDDVDC